MNKSKFLKKSLAMVLAVMMIVAMIPLGASAAVGDAPVAAKVTVGNVNATLDGSTWTATDVSNAAASTAKVVVVIDDQDTGTVTASGAASCTDNGKSEWEITPSADQYTKKELSFTTWNTSTRKSNTYTVKWTVAAASTDNSIASVGFTDQNTQYGSTSVSGHDFVVTAAYANVNSATDTLTLKAGSAAATVAVTGATAARVGTSNAYTITGYTLNTAFTVTVTPEVGPTAVYTVKVVTPDYFPTFSAEGERKATEVTMTGALAGDVKIYLPYGYTTVADAGGAKYYEIPLNFTVGYPSATVKTKYHTAAAVIGGTADKEVKSGDKIYVPVASPNAATLTYSYPSASGADSTFTVKVDIPAKDPVAAITAAQVGAYKATVNGKTITAQLPASYMAGASSVALQVKGSVGSKIELVGTSDTISTATGSLENLVAAFDASVEGTYTIRVTSTQADDNGAFDEQLYTLKVVKVGVAEEAKILSMVLTDKDGEKYTAAINGYNVTFTLPYSLTAQGDLQDWTLDTGISAGAKAEFGAGTVLPDSYTVTGSEGLFPATFPVDENAPALNGTNSVITVTASNNSQHKYTVLVKKAAPEVGHSIESLGVVPATMDNTTFDEDGIYTATMSGTTLTVEVPFNDYISKTFANASAMKSVFTLSKGAKLYVIPKTAKNAETLTGPVATTSLSADVDGTVIATKGEYFDGVDTNGKDDNTVALTLVVASEGAANLTNYDTSWWTTNAGKYTEYKLIVKCKTAKTVCGVPTVTLFNNRTLETVTGAVSGNTITFGDIPFHFIADAAANNIYLDYKVNNGEWVAIPSKGTWITPITYDAAGNYASGGVKITAIAETSTGSGVYNLTGAAGLYIETEAGNKGSNTVPNQVYTISGKVAPAETGCLMTSMTINNITGRPDSNNKITINLPVGSEVTSLIPTFVVSKHATVHLGNAAGTEVFSGVNAYNFTADQTFTVVSEDQNHSKTYTVHVEAAASFDDVKPTDWFYGDVMRAFSLGIVTGTSATTFTPNGMVTRGHFAVMLARADGYNYAAYMTESPFTDVAAGTETAAAVAYCKKMGYLGGYPDGSYKPNKTITREEMSKLLVNACGLTQVTEPTTKFADDATIADWAKGYVYAAQQAGLMVGRGTNFAPKALTKRCEACTAVLRVYDAK